MNGYEAVSEISQTSRSSLVIPSLGRSLLFGTGYPPPLSGCKILKTRDLFCDYMLDL